ncbi:uncharacterized protein LOC131935442 [Physella acuta]|uniref:uncharacterized protein LOC131935442 n=1 Tax=Physella acuta TaxID=109671 RepID=UPI0027DBAB5A|nr:uncharacterized protein LOC131935442 [Physella acuta]
MTNKMAGPPKPNKDCTLRSPVSGGAPKPNKDCTLRSPVSGGTPQTKQRLYSKIPCFRRDPPNQTKIAGPPKPNKDCTLRSPVSGGAPKPNKDCTLRSPVSGGTPQTKQRLYSKIPCFRRDPPNQTKIAGPPKPNKDCTLRSPVSGGAPKPNKDCTLRSPVSGGTPQTKQRLYSKIPCFRRDPPNQTKIAGPPKPNKDCTLRPPVSGGAPKPNKDCTLRPPVSGGTPQTKQRLYSKIPCFRRDPPNQTKIAGPPKPNKDCTLRPPVSGGAPKPNKDCTLRSPVLGGTPQTKQILYSKIPCFRRDPPNQTKIAGPPELGYNVMVFDSDSQNFANMDMNCCDLWDDMGLVFYLYPYSLDGVVIEYLADKKLPDVVLSMTVELVGGNVRATVRDDKNVEVNVLMTGEVLQVHRWAVVILSRQKTTGDIIIQVNQTVQVLPAAFSKAKQFNSRGQVYVSHPLAAGKVKYQGRVCCLAFFNALVPKNIDPQVVTSWFTEAQWPNPAPTVKANCPVGVNYTGPPITKIWPLNTSNCSSFGYEVIQGLPPIAPPYFTCLRSKENCVFTDNPVVYFDGSELSFLKADFPDQTMAGNFTVAMFIKPDTPMEGVVLDYVASPTNLDGISRLTLTLNAGLVNLEMRNKLGVCFSLTSLKMLSTTSWAVVYFIYSAITNSVALYVNDTSVSKPMGCVRTSATTSMGVIYLGNSLTFDSGYHGSAACLTVAQGVMDNTTAVSVFKERCLTLDLLVVTDGGANDTDICNATLIGREKRFKLTSENNQPDPVLNPISVDFARSVLECASRCARMSQCRSLTYRNTSRSSNCALYDLVTRKGLVADPGNKYYTITLSQTL